MAWNISGQYLETCNCDYLCPCPLTGLAKSTHGFCIFAMGFRVDRGQFDGIPLDGRSFVVIGHTPGNMGEGNWKVGLVVDDAADEKQREALTAIVSGQAGGPMANLAPLIGEFAGVEAAPIRIEGSGKNWSVTAGGFVDESLEGVAGLGGEPLALDGTGHPANTRFSLANAKKSHVHAFGIDWDQEDGRNNGQFAPFDWSG
jgi:hypothetical protein